MAVRLLNAVVGVLTALLTYWLARRTARPNVALAAGLVVALYPSFLLYTALIATEAAVGAPLLGALVAATYGSRRAAVVAGVCAGLTVLTRPAGIALLPAALVAVARQCQPKNEVRWSPVKPLLVIAMFVATMAPWWIHNARVHGRFVPLDTTSGYNMLIGNGPYATGQFHWREVGRLHAEHLRGIDISTPEGSSAAASLAIAHVWAHPLVTMALVPAKISAIFAVEGREHMVLYSSGYFGPLSSNAVWIWGVLIMAAFPLLLAVALAGWAVRDGVDEHVLYPCAGIIAVAVLLHVFTFGDPRYHLPLVPVLAVLSTGLSKWRQGFDLRRVAVGVLFLVWLSGPWSRQLAAYREVLPKLAAPNGWTQPQAYIDLQ